MRAILTSSLFPLCALLTLLPVATPAAHPNIVIILADDQGWGDLSINGNSNLSTPRIDSLAKDGALLERFYVCPVCSPTRAEFLTGRYHPRGGVHGVSTGGERLNLDEKTIAPSANGITAPNTRIIPTPAGSTNITGSPPATGAPTLTRRWSTMGSLSRAKASSLMILRTTR